ncbi:MAG: hypothetical protein ACRC17_11295 [Culicoidibacterales bacterium]
MNTIVATLLPYFIWAFLIGLGTVVILAFLKLFKRLIEAIEKRKQ